MKFVPRMHKEFELSLTKKIGQFLGSLTILEMNLKIFQSKIDSNINFIMKL